MFRNATGLHGGMRSVGNLTKLTDRVAPGPSPSFSASHVILVFLTIAGSNYIGRQPLAERANLGKGAIRTILKKLRDQGYVGAIKAGCYLTPSGESLAKSIGAQIRMAETIPRSGLTVGRYHSALVLRSAGAKVKSGIEQRDSAIRTGASGATTYVMKGGRFTIPGESVDCEKEFPSEAWPSLKAGLKPKNGDAVILCGAEDQVSARLGALAAAITLL
jgi:hypothetical protein